MVNVNNVRKISDFLFPFPYAQLTSSMLLLNMLVTPVLSSILLQTWYACASLSFVTIFAFFSLNYIATEIERPFGLDDNDLPMAGFQACAGGGGGDDLAGALAPPSLDTSSIPHRHPAVLFYSLWPAAGSQATRGRSRQTADL